MAVPRPPWRRPHTEGGATAVEYGLLIALVAAVIIGLLTTIGSDLLGFFSDAAGWFEPPDS